MGGNGAYIRSEDGVPMYNRTHTDTGYRVDGHKVLVQTSNPVQKKMPMNSNSESPYYLGASVNDRTNVLTVDTIGIYEKHKLVETVDIVVDFNGNFIPYANKGKSTSHSHKWPKDENGIVGRKSRDSQNHLPIAPKYQRLIEDIIKFNKSQKTWKK